MKLVFATHNLHKFEEVRTMMPLGIELLNLNDIGCFEDIPETASTIEGNAQIKMEYVKEHYGFDCFADDTGLEVTILNGAPGVYSARYAGPEKDDRKNMEQLLLALKDAADRSAQFKTVIALCFRGQTTLITGICRGEITQAPMGNKGFGYDPIFCPEGGATTFAQMSQEEKATIGHRGRAIRQLLAVLSASIDA